MSKLLELSLKVIQRLQELELVPEESEEDFESVEENLADSLESFYKAAERFLADDFSALNCQEEFERLGDHVVELVVKVTRLNDDMESLEEGLKQVMHHLPKEALRDTRDDP